MRKGAAAMVMVSIMLMVEGCASESRPRKRTAELPDFDTMWDYSDPAGSEAQFRQLIPVAKESGDTSYYVQLLTQIARAQGLQRKFDDAHQTLDTAETILREQLAVAHVRYLLERGRVYNSSNAPQKARSFFLKAYERATAHGEDFYAIDAVHMLQIVEPPEKQLDWAEKAIAMAESSTDQRARKWLGPLYNNTGWTYFDLKQYDAALGLFQKSLQWRQEQKDEEGIRIAKWTIARTYREIGKVEEALKIQKALESERKEKGLEPSGYVFEEIGECLLLLDRMEEARSYFRHAYDILSQDEWLQANESDRLTRLKRLGE